MWRYPEEALAHKGGVISTPILRAWVQGRSIFHVQNLGTSNTVPQKMAEDKDAENPQVGLVSWKCVGWRVELKLKILVAWG